MNVSILMAIDVQRALAEGSLSNAIYMMDTNGELDASTEGSNSLETTCKNRNSLIWHVVPINPNTTASLSGFSGAMVDEKICIPRQRGEQGHWRGLVRSKGKSGEFSYIASISLEGMTMTATGTLNLVPK